MTFQPIDCHISEQLFKNLLNLFSVELKLIWLVINCLEWLVIRAINMVSLCILKHTKSEIEIVFEKRFDSKVLQDC